MEDNLEFSQKVGDLAARSRHASKLALTEEATKTSVILPLIQLLGFDVFNLEEVVPEFVADVGIKKGEKIDFAVNISGKLAILIEAKPISMSLGTAQYSQLYRYFGTVAARLAILTNGKEVWFFSDTDEKNKMDKKPFFVFDLQNYDERQVEDLARFQKSVFDIEAILDAASNSKYVKAGAAYLSQQLAKPDDEFVRFMGRQMYDGTLTKAVVEQLRPMISASLDEVIRNRIQQRLNVTFGKDSQPPESVDKKSPENVDSAAEVVTTEDEHHAFMIVRAISSKVVAVKRVTMRDAKSYCSVFLDDKNTKPICRFYFNAKKVRYLGLFDAEKIETKVTIDDLAEIYKYADQIVVAVSAYK